MDRHGDRDGAARADGVRVDVGRRPGDEEPRLARRRSAARRPSSGRCSGPLSRSGASCACGHVAWYTWLSPRIGARTPSSTPACAGRPAAGRSPSPPCACCGQRCAGSRAELGPDGTGSADLQRSGRAHPQAPLLGGGVARRDEIGLATEAPDGRGREVAREAPDADLCASQARSGPRRRCGTGGCRPRRSTALAGGSGRNGGPRGRRRPATARVGQTSSPGDHWRRASA